MVRFSLIGATGNVGRHALEQLVQKGVAPEHITLIASPRSQGTTVEREGYTWTVQEFSEAAVQDQEICLLATETDISRQYVPRLLESTSAFVLDSSSAYRLDCNVPLMVEPLNGEKITLSKRLYAHANCVAGPVSMILFPLRALGLRTVHVCTYQSAAGAGLRAMEELQDHTQAFFQNRPVQPVHFPHPIAFNAMPHIGELGENGPTSEEDKIVREVQKILQYTFSIFATAVRIPTLRGHGISTWIQLQEDVSPAVFAAKLREAPGLHLLEAEAIPTPQSVIGEDRVVLGRVYKAAPYHFHVWSCSDNLLRGAATDLVETALRLGDLLKKG